MNRILRFLPAVRPVQFFVARIRSGGRTTTAITRVWAPGDTHRCRLCPADRCGADHDLGVCMVMTTRKVPDRLAPLFRFRD